MNWWWCLAQLQQWESLPLVWGQWNECKQRPVKDLSGCVSSQLQREGIRVWGGWRWCWTPADLAGAAGGLASEPEGGPTGEMPWVVTPPGSERCSSSASSLPPPAFPRLQWSACHPPGPPGYGSAPWWPRHSVWEHAWPWAPCTGTGCTDDTNSAPSKYSKLWKDILNTNWWMWLQKTPLW